MQSPLFPGRCWLLLGNMKEDWICEHKQRHAYWQAPELTYLNWAGHSLSFVALGKGGDRKAQRNCRPWYIIWRWVLGGRWVTDLITFLSSLSSLPFVPEIYSLYLEEYVLETDMWTPGQNHVFRQSLKHAFSVCVIPALMV